MKNVKLKTITIASDQGAELQVQHNDDGFCLFLVCADGKSWANGQFFTWPQIAQLLVAADPDMFGIIQEPLHHIFPETLVALGFNVPGWPNSIVAGSK